MSATDEESPAGSAALAGERRAVALLDAAPGTVRTWLEVTGGSGLLLPVAPDRTWFFGDVPGAVAVAVVGTSLHRDTPATVLWLDREDDEVAGLVAVERGRVVTAHAWSSDADRDQGDAAVLARAFGRTGAEVGVRALLRRTDQPLSRLEDAAGLLGLPACAVHALREDRAPVGAEPAAPSPGRPRWTAAVRAARATPDPPWLTALRRWRWLAPGALATCFAGRSATAFLMHPPAGEDVLGYGVLGLVCTAGAVWQRHRARRDRG